jgi:hypothetical protein
VIPSHPDTIFIAYMFVQFQPEEYVAHHEAVFVDANSTVNLLTGVPLCSLDMVSEFLHIFWL